MSRRALLLFTRVPEPGKTKTRLMPRLTAEQCAELHRCFLSDVAAQCRKCSADLLVCFTPPDRKDLLVELLGRDLTFFPQEGESLGEGMERAMNRALAMGYSSCLLFGSDIPELTCGLFGRAFEALQNCDAVFAPTADGGYCLAGLKKPCHAAFSLKNYGHSGVLEQTLSAVREAGCSVRCLHTLQDMDTPDDLEDFRRRMRSDRRLRRSATGRFLARHTSVSIIVPLYNEAGTVEVLQDQLEPLLSLCEIILVDGGSTDGTLGKIRPAFRLIHAPKGRALQMNAGARASNGEVLFFLHSDSRLPSRPLERIGKVMASHRAGCFGVTFQSPGFFLRLCSVASNVRAFLGKIMFGDQGIFIERTLFFELGLYPEIPIMEDYRLSLTLRERGIAPGMTLAPISTSARRFPEKPLGILRLLWKMNRLRKQYRDGVPPEEIARQYRDFR